MGERALGWRGLGGKAGGAGAGAGGAPLHSPFPCPPPPPPTHPRQPPPPPAPPGLAGTDFYAARLALPPDAYEINFIFSDGQGAWDNNFAQASERVCVVCVWGGRARCEGCRPAPPPLAPPPPPTHTHKQNYSKGVDGPMTRELWIETTAERAVRARARASWGGWLGGRCWGAPGGLLPPSPPPQTDAHPTPPTPAGGCLARAQGGRAARRRGRRRRARGAGCRCGRGSSQRGGAGSGCAVWRMAGGRSGGRPRGLGDQAHGERRGWMGGGGGWELCVCGGGGERVGVGGRWLWHAPQPPPHLAIAHTPAPPPPPPPRSLAACRGGGARHPALQPHGWAHRWI